MNKGRGRQVDPGRVHLLPEARLRLGTEPTGNGTYSLKLRAFTERAMWIVKSTANGGCQTTIAGKQALIEPALRGHGRVRHHAEGALRRRLRRGRRERRRPHRAPRQELNQRARSSNGPRSPHSEPLPPRDAARKAHGGPLRSRLGMQERACQTTIAPAPFSARLRPGGPRPRARGRCGPRARVSRPQRSGASRCRRCRSCRAPRDRFRTGPGRGPGGGPPRPRRRP